MCYVGTGTIPVGTGIENGGGEGGRGGGKGKERKKRKGERKDSYSRIPIAEL
jgi:hypothetical protein